jgi:hypothetical protein
MSLLTLLIIVLVVAVIFGGLGTRGRWGRRVTVAAGLPKE